MKNEEIKKQVSRKVFLINSFLYTASLATEGGHENALKQGVTSHYLQSVVLELIIKILYELNLKKLAPFNHNVLEIFDSLNKESKEFVERNFNDARERKKKLFENIDNSVQFHPLRDVLVSNEKIIKNFKYDAMGSPTNSSVDAMFYNEILSYINRELGKL